MGNSAIPALFMNKKHYVNEFTGRRTKYEVDFSFHH